MHDDDDKPVRSGAWVRVGLALLALGAAVGLVLFMIKYLAKPSTKVAGVQQIALIKQPPPPPPPKPPEKPPEPPKIKEEIKVEQPKDEPKPAEQKAPDEKPASDKPLGVDAEGTAGSDGFGLAGNKGGRDLVGSGGGGGGGAYYTGLLQRGFFEALSRNRKVLKDEYRVVVRIWLSDDGHVTRADIVTGSGNAGTDDLIRVTLLDMNPLKDVPPASMRPVQLRLSNRS